MPNASVHRRNKIYVETNGNIFCTETCQMCIIHRASKNCANIFFVLCLSNINRFQQKLVGMSWKEHLTKLCKKMPTSFNICASTTLANLKSQIEPSMLYTYMYILMYHRAATNTTGSYCLKNRQVYSKLRHLYITCSKCPSPARIRSQMSTNWDDASKTSERSQSRSSLNVQLAT